MRGTSRLLLTLFLAGALLPAGGCTNNALDDGDSANVVLLIDEIDNPVVNTQFDSDQGVCVFVVEEWAARLRNEPKTDLAVTSPFNDIEVTEITIGYSGSLALAPQTFPAGATIPPEGTGQLTFFPIRPDEIPASFENGGSAELTVVFRGRALDGEDVETPVTAVGGAQLAVNACLSQGGG